MSMNKPGNDSIAARLDHIADLLEAQDANPYRVRFYREAASQVRQTEESVAELADKNHDALTDIPGVGDKLGGVIKEFVHTGRISLLERLEEEHAPGEVLQRVPGVGDELAERIVDQLGVKTLEDLEQAAHDGRLGEVEGFGESRVQAVKDSLGGILSRSSSADAGSGSDDDAEEPPPVSLLLDIDSTYREKADAGELRTIAPKRFNPEGEAWLPIMESSRQGWNFTALFSNTARAHDLDKTRDWVVIYYQKHDSGEEHQCTLVTSQRGGLEGRRVVRGREAECRHYYNHQDD